MSINDRIALLLKDKNLTANEFAQRLKVQSSNISHIITGRNKPSFSFLEKLALEFPEVSTDWLIRGEGAMYISDKDFSGICKTENIDEENIVSGDHPYQNSLFDFFEEKEDTSEQVKIITAEEEKVSGREIPYGEADRVKIMPQNVSPGGIKNIIVYYNNGSFEEFVPK